MSCCCVLVDPKKRETEPQDSLVVEGPDVAVAFRQWSRIAVARSYARPSCRKKTRWPSPHNGAVRNSWEPAKPPAVKVLKFGLACDTARTR
jgi:hypothetical protein